MKRNLLLFTALSLSAVFVLGCQMPKFSSSGGQSANNSNNQVDRNENQADSSNNQGESNQKTGTREYKNDKYGFSFDYPENWSVDFGNEYLGIDKDHYVVFWNGKEEQLNLQVEDKGKFSSFSETGRAFNKKEEERSSVDGQELILRHYWNHIFSPDAFGGVLVLATSIPAYKISDEVISDPQGRYDFSLEYSYKPGSEKAAKEYFKRILGSFKF